MFQKRTDKIFEPNGNNTAGKLRRFHKWAVHTLYGLADFIRIRE
jgi:hypothetical protein